MALITLQIPKYILSPEYGYIGIFIVDEVENYFRPEIFLSLMILFYTNSLVVLKRDIAYNKASE
ncbi:Uncharacterized protein dnl_62930 [Desulfonema limicola]|uniref:Uncharacterized protein n=1 Tax=Desulfonema limicola TaxID=45656 RepID=A0A975BEG2_9BACT|nr:Uncharacterized protein dnl_62930 [Desulfonema limicola]